MTNTTKEIKTERIMLRLTTTQRQKLEAYTAANETTAAQLFRKLLNDFLN